MSVPNWRAQRACISLQARVASLAGMSTPSTSAAVFFVTPEKSREPAPPHRTNVRPMAPRRTHASHCWPCRPSRIRCSIPCPKKTTLKRLAERTGLEPATPGVTGRYSNQLNYRSNFMARLVLAIPFQTLKLTPGRRKGAKFSKESEKYTRDACPFLAAVPGINNPRHFPRHEPVCGGVPVGVHRRPVQRSVALVEVPLERVVAVDHVHSGLCGEHLQPVIGQGRPPQ